jgi:hypothetical protein
MWFIGGAGVMFVSDQPLHERANEATLHAAVNEVRCEAHPPVNATHSNVGGMQGSCSSASSALAKPSSWNASRMVDRRPRRNRDPPDQPQAARLLDQVEALASRV